MTTLQYIDPDAGQLCAHCQRRKEDHHLVNWSAEGLGAGKAALICPTSMFQKRITTSREAAARARAEDSR